MNFEHVYNNISIIIPFHKNKNMIELSIETLMKTIKKIPIHIIANNQNEAEIDIRLPYDNIFVHKINKNLFWPGAINYGAKIVDTEYLLFCDPDIFYWDGWIEALIKCYIKHDNVGVISSKIINPLTNRIMDFGMAYLQYNVIHISKGLMYNHPYVNADREVQSACGAIFLTSKEHFELVNGIDEEMPYIYCDNDYSIKLKQFNLKTWVAADSIVYHIGNTSQNNSKYYSFKYLREDSKAAFYFKNGTKREIDFEKWLNKSIYWYLSNNNKFDEKYIFVNLSSFIESQEYLNILVYQNNVKIYDIYKYPPKERNVNHIMLNDVIDNCLIDIPIPLIYFVDNFTSLFNNMIWSKLRNTSRDIIIDIHANIIKFNDIIENKI